MTSAAIYTRVSSDRQEIDGTSLDTQMASCRAYCVEQGYDVVSALSDTWTGSQYRERPGLSQLREMIRAGAIDVLIVHAVDRLSRSQAHVAILLEEMTDNGVRLEPVTEDFEDSAVGRFILAARSFAGEIEREKLIERTARGRRARASAGKLVPGQKPPFGYRWVDGNAALVIHDEEAVLVRRIFRAYVEGGTLRATAAGLTDDGIPSPTGKPRWGISTVRHILKSRVYLGEVTSHGDIELPEGTAPAIIDAATFDRAQARLSTNRQRARRNAKYPDDVAILRGGVAVCGLCGAALNVIRLSTRDGSYIYRCKTALAGAGCRHHHMRTHRLDDAVWAGLADFLTREDVFDQTADERGATSDPGPELTQIERTVASLDRQRDNLARSIAATDDPDTQAVLVAQLEQITARRRELESERKVVAGWAEKHRLSQRMMDDFNRWRREMAGKLDSLPPAGRRELLDMLGVQVRLWPSSVTPRWVATSEVMPSIVFSSAGSSEHNDPIRFTWSDPQPVAAD